MTDRFWKKVAVGGEDDCWEWQGSTNGRYGKLTINGKGVYAHRHALSLKLGRKLRGHALHSCDNPPCCNPRHLREGTHKENIRESKRAKITMEIADQIRSLALSGSRSKDIAAQFNISPQLVGQIVSRRRWT